MHVYVFNTKQQRCLIPRYHTAVHLQFQIYKNTNYYLEKLSRQSRNNSESIKDQFKVNQGSIQSQPRINSESNEDQFRVIKSLLRRAAILLLLFNNRLNAHRHR